VQDGKDLGFGPRARPDSCPANQGLTRSPGSGVRSPWQPSSFRLRRVRRIYGISPGFSGLGYTIRGSQSGPPYVAQKSLREAIVPEYLLPNSPLAELGCACIIVPPYPGRSQDPLDPRFVAERGGPECPKVDRLRPAPPGALRPAP
jgi:hypothetical protein